MKAFLATIVVELALVSAAIYRADLDHRWHRGAIAPAHELAREEVWSVPDWSVDLTRANIAYWEKAGRFDVLLLGSSRSEYYYREMFDDKLRFFNGWLSGARIEDYVAHWQALKEMGKVPPRIILFLDPWQFNAKWWPENKGWRRNRRLVAAFNGRSSALDELRERAADALDSLQELVSFIAFVRAARSFWEPSRETGADLRGFRSDGAHPSYDLAPVGLSRAALADELRRGERVRSPAPYQNPYAYNAEAAGLLKRLTADMTARGVKVMVVVPPAHPAAFAPYPKDLAGSAELRDFEALLREVTQPPILLCDVEKPGSAGCAETDYLDIIHTGKSCARRVLNDCLGRDKDWRRLLR